MFAAGCMSIKTRRAIKEEIHIQMEASQDHSSRTTNEQARACQTLASDRDLIPSTGVYYSGVIEGIPRRSGVILAKRRLMVRVIGQAPVVATNISTGERRRNVPDFYSIEKHVPGRRDFARARIEKAD